METIERLRHSFQKNTNASVNAQAILTILVAVGFIISGIVEHGVTVALSPSSFRTEISGNDSTNETRARRYCDPPNMTALAIYYDSSEEDNIDDNYDVSQLQEMFFQTTLTRKEEMEILLKKFYLWGTLFSPIPASRLAVNIGPKRVFGYSLLGAAAATLLVPAAWLTPAHIVIRFFQGLFCGALIPSAHALAINWFPALRRSSFVSWYSGRYIGYALCEFLTVKVLTTMGPGSIYYITSILTGIWFVPWSMIVFSTPAMYLKYSTCQKETTSTTTPPVKFHFPLKHLLGSRPVWMCIGAVFGAYCGQISINMAMRLYLKYVYNITNGLLSAIPFIMHTVFSVFCGYLVDYIQEIQFVSITSSRRMFVYVSHFIPAGLLFVIGFVGCDSTAPIILYSLAIITSGAMYAGALCSPLDIAPKHASTIVAFCCTFGSAGSILMSYLISNVLDGEVLGSWRLTFSLTSLILLISSIFFMLRGSGAIQIWNDWKPGDPEIGNGKKLKEQSLDNVDGNAPKTRTKSIYTVEKKILKVLHVQEPERFTRARAHSTSLANDQRTRIAPNIYRPHKKRASIS